MKDKKSLNSVTCTKFRETWVLQEVVEGDAKATTGKPFIQNIRLTVSDALNL